MKALGPEEGRGSNPYYAGNFDGESDELRDLRLTLVAERDALKATFGHALAECRDAYPVPEVGSELEGLWGQAMGDPASVGAYVKACAVGQQKEIDELRAELEGRYQSIIEMGNMLTEIVNLIRGEPEEGTSHSTHDAVELVRGLAMHNDLYATAVELEVAKLKAENERLTNCLKKANDQAEDFERRWYLVDMELERIKALPPVAEVRLNMTGGNAGLSTHIVQLAEGYFPAGTKLYALGSNHE